MATHAFASETPPRAGMIQTFSDDFNRSELKDGINWKTTFPGGLRTITTTGEKQLYLDDDYRSPITKAAIPFDAHHIEKACFLSMQSRHWALCLTMCACRLSPA